MSFCKSCGKNLRDGAKFCGKCGAKKGAAPARAAAPQPAGPAMPASPYNPPPCPIGAKDSGGGNPLWAKYTIFLGIPCLALGLGAAFANSHGWFGGKNEQGEISLYEANRAEQERAAKAERELADLKYRQAIQERAAKTERELADLKYRQAMDGQQLGKAIEQAMQAAPAQAPANQPADAPRQRAQNGSIGPIMTEQAKRAAPAQAPANQPADASRQRAQNGSIGPIMDVPFVVSRPQQLAERMLRDAGFEVEVVFASSLRPQGQVIATEPKGGSQLSKGATVKLRVSQGRQ